MYANNENVIILTDRDKAEYEYLCKVRGEQSVVWASQNLAGKRKPYISNLAKILKVDIPNDLHIGVEVVSAEQAQMYLMDIKKILAGIKN